MKTIGFPISSKKNEKRRCLFPSDLSLVRNVKNVYIERGYGEVLGIKDKEYLNFGAVICSREEVLKQDIICDPKVGEADYLDQLNQQIVFGWVHAVQNKDIVDKIIKSELTVYAWEDMYDSGRHVFYRNNEIAGEAAVFHAYMCHGLFPYETNVAILGNGNTARGAYKLLTMLGAKVTLYNRNTETLFRKELNNYDVIVNAILWDTNRRDHIIYKDDLLRMRENSLIIDISCDRAGGIETSIPTSLENPIYVIHGVTHYVVDHTPTLFYKTISKDLSQILTGYLDDLITDKVNETLRNSLIIQGGYIIDKRINVYQKRL